MPTGLKHSYTRSEYISPTLPKDDHPKQTRRDIQRSQWEHIALGRSVPDGSNDENERTVSVSRTGYEQAITPERKRYEKSNLIDKNSLEGSATPRRGRYDPVPYTPKHSVSYERKYKHYAPLEKSYEHSRQERKWYDDKKNFDQQEYDQDLSERTVSQSNLSRSKSEKMGLDRIVPSDKYRLNLRHRRSSSDRDYQSLNGNKDYQSLSSSQTDMENLHTTPALQRSRGESLFS